MGPLASREGNGGVVPDTRRETLEILEEALLPVFEERKPMDPVSDPEKPVLPAAGIERLVQTVAQILGMEPEKAVQLLVQASGGSLTPVEARGFLKALAAWMVRAQESLQAGSSLVMPMEGESAGSMMTLPEDGRVPIEGKLVPEAPPMPLEPGSGTPSIDRIVKSPTWQDPTAFPRVKDDGEKIVGMVAPTADAVPANQAAVTKSVADLVSLLSGSDAGRIVLHVAETVTPIQEVPVLRAVIPTVPAPGPAPDGEPTLAAPSLPAPDVDRPDLPPPPTAPLERPSREVAVVLPEVRQALETFERQTAFDVYRQASLPDRKADPAPAPSLWMKPLTVDAVMEREPIPVRLETLPPSVPSKPAAQPVMDMPEIPVSRPMDGPVLPPMMRPPVETPVAPPALEVPEPSPATIPGKKTLPVETEVFPRVDLAASVPDQVRIPATVPSSETVTLPPSSEAEKVVQTPQAVLGEGDPESAAETVKENIVKGTPLVDPKSEPRGDLAVRPQDPGRPETVVPSGVKPSEASGVVPVGREIPRQDVKIDLNEPRDLGTHTWAKSDVSVAAAPTVTASKPPVHPFQAAAPAVDPADLVRQIANQVQSQIARTHVVSRLSFQLIPESLGRVTIQVAVVDQTVSARILVAAPEVREALQHHMVELRTSLNQAGLQIDQLQVHVQGGSGQGLAMYYQYQREGFANELRGVATNVVEQDQVNDPSPEEARVTWGRMNLVNVLV
jgi:hypothetical protein